ncbi:Ribonuclease Z 1 [Coniochaeta hoffmannii]|uniref:ribonuclease Z n=1 Tax=Coniochaeta hoffmannii TaxID=91930 RepID=A0AA38RWD6_9PEZI|nr:Ribonuclease Z 1 [Coniochaeta hoffmannii]
MLAYVDIISTPTVDTGGACLRLHFDNRHYVFGNVSEGTQRIMASKRMSMAKVEDIFLTGPVDWHAHGGLMGFLLTIADVHETIATAIKDANKEKAAKGKKVDPVKTLDHVTIHAGRGLTHMLATARRFVFRKSFPLVPQEIRRDPREDAGSSDEPDWADGNIRVWYVPVQSERATEAWASKSKKRKAEHMSDSDGDTAPARPENGGETTPSQDEVDHQMRLGVVKQMFNGKGPRKYQTVDALQEVKLGCVKQGATKYIRDENGELEPYNGPADPEIKVLVRQDWKAADVPHLPPTEPAHMSMCYIVKVPPGKGKFNVARAVELGVEKHNFKLLVDGKTVPGKDGTEVTPDMVVAPAGEPSGFALVEVPDMSYIDSLLARPEWSNEKIMGGIAAMYWTVRTPEVLNDERVLTFMRKTSSMKHVVLSRAEGGSPGLIQNSAVEMTRLNRVNSDIFPTLAHTDGDASSATRHDATLPYEIGMAGVQLRLKPQVRATNDNIVVPIKEEEVMEKFVADPNILRLAQEARAKVSDPAFIAEMEAATADLPNRDAEVIPLGTGSALPSRSRNVSCTLIRVPGIGSYLLDCGENSLGQLRRMYGFEGADAVLRDLKAIWISHSHADHHLGTVSVLKRFSQVVPVSPSPETQQKLALIAHPSYHHFLAEYSQLEPIGLTTHITQLSNDTPTEPPSPTNNFTKGLHRPLDDPSILSPFGLSQVAICKVDHCEDARAVALTLTSGLKIAYSGDCRPSRQFASHRVGLDAHLLVHEATLDDDLQKDAVAKKHCTISEALGVAKEMRAKNVLLTHFSQRYPKLPEVGNVGEGKGGAPVVFAFDFMRVRLGEFRAAREFLGALQRLYNDEGDGQGDGEREMRIQKALMKRGKDFAKNGAAQGKAKGGDKGSRDALRNGDQEAQGKIQEKVVEGNTADV